MTCGNINILPFYGICVDDTHGMYTITKFTKGGFIHELIQRRKKLPLRDVPRIAIDITKGIFFLIDHGIMHIDLNTMGILLHKQGNTTIAEIGLVHPCEMLGEVLEYETRRYKWLAPNVCQSIL